MEHQVSAALREFTQRYVAQWQQQHGDWPSSHALYGIPSPCVVYSRDDCVFWRPEPGRGEDLEGLAGRWISGCIRHWRRFYHPVRRRYARALE